MLACGENQMFGSDAASAIASIATVHAFAPDGGSSKSGQAAAPQAPSKAIGCSFADTEIATSAKLVLKVPRAGHILMRNLNK